MMPSNVRSKVDSNSVSQHGILVAFVNIQIMSRIYLSMPVTKISL